MIMQVDINFSTLVAHSGFVLVNHNPFLLMTAVTVQNPSKHFPIATLNTCG